MGLLRLRPYPLIFISHPRLVGIEGSRVAVHLVNDPFLAVDDMLAGLIAANRHDVEKTASGRGVYTLSANPKRRIALIVGGGSGHEPAFVGWVGTGLADGAAIGNVFASPSAESVIELVQALPRPGGALFLYGNYEGDIMNFRLASAFVADEGVDTLTVLVTDDVASAPASEAHRRRGVAGSVIVAKLTGAFADNGPPLDEVADLARNVNHRTHSIGAALSPCHLPTAAKPSFDLPPGLLDFGIGVHGEAGSRREPLRTADELADEMLELLLKDLGDLQSEESLCVLVNSFGGTPLLEAYIVLGRVLRSLAQLQVRVSFANAGSYLTSLQMAGISLTISSLNSELEHLLYAPAFPVAIPRLGGAR